MKTNYEDQEQELLFAGAVASINRDIEDDLSDELFVSWIDVSKAGSVYDLHLEVANKKDLDDNEDLYFVIKGGDLIENYSCSGTSISQMVTEPTRQLLIQSINQYKGN